MLGYHDVRPSGAQTWPSSSCSMKRPTRVPASSVVRMNSASNMIAKWYQSARPRAAEHAAEDARHADGEARRAAGARRAASPRPSAAASASSCSGVQRRSPTARSPAPRSAAVAPSVGGADVDREVDAGVERRGRDQRHDADERFHQHAAVADQARVGLARQHLRRRAARDQRVEAGDRRRRRS